MNNFNEDIEQLREEIDSLDIELISILAQRIRVVEAVGKKKTEYGLKPFDRKRWKIVLNSRIALGKEAGLSLVLVRSIFIILHRHSLYIQKRLRL